MAPGTSSAMTMKRIRREISDIQKEDLGSIVLAPTEDNMHVWKGSIPGPEGSVYEGGVFNVEVTLPQDYPFSAPKVLFKTRIYHMNISEQGSICIDILKQNWSPALSLFKVMLSLSSLLTDPNPKDPLVPSVATQYVRNRRLHDSTARQWTEMYAQPKPQPKPQPQPGPAPTHSPVPTPNLPPTSPDSRTRSQSQRQAPEAEAPPMPAHRPTSASGSVGSSSVAHVARSSAASAGSSSLRTTPSASDVIIIDSDDEDANISAVRRKRKRRDRDATLTERRGAGAGSSTGGSSTTQPVVIDVVDSDGDDDEQVDSHKRQKRRDGASSSSGRRALPLTQLGDVIVIED